MNKPSAISRRNLLKAMGTVLAAAPFASAVVQAANSVNFLDIARSSGITFQHENAASAEKYLIETMGSGCGWIDYGQNGLLDLYLGNGASTRAHSFAKPPRSALYRNNGDGTFTDVTSRAGVGAEDLFGMGVAVGDYDNDGDGTFTDVTRKAGVGNTERWGSSAAWFDYDNDGHLDLVIANYVDWS